MKSEKLYTVLKTAYFEVNKLALVPVIVDIKFPHLILAIFTPEVSTGLEEALNRLNLKPYEQSVRKFQSADFMYNPMEFNQPGKREIKGITEFVSGTTNSNNKCPLIVAYIELIEP